MYEQNIMVEFYDLDIIAIYNPILTYVLMVNEAFWVLIKMHT